jgi:hypothetical protein
MVRKTLSFLAAASLAAVCAAQNAPAGPAARPADPNAPPASGKVSGILSCGKPEPAHRIDVPDWPGHAATASKSPCTWTKPAEIAGVATKEGYSVGSSDVDNTITTERGSHVTTMATGDRIYVQFRGKGQLAASGAPLGSEGTWNFKGGSGLFAGLQGMGTYRGKANPDGSMTFTIEGTWKM